MTKVSGINTVALSGGWFSMGSNDAPHPQDGEGPLREVWVDPFSIATTTVTNAEFAAFVLATGYRTSAEIIGHSFVFHLFNKGADKNTQVATPTPWWHAVNGACWQRPAGLDSSIESKPDYPAVHIAHTDALAFCQWAGTRLPTEAEWEYAARGGLQNQPYPWGNQLRGNQLQGDNAHRCNIWQGLFPTHNSGDDGYVGTAPTTAYAPNAFGLYNTSGNVWEWTADRHTTLHSPRPVENPKGPLNGEQYVLKGGSYLCHHSYCTRYRTSSRQGLSAESTADNLGFRVAINSS